MCSWITSPKFLVGVISNRLEISSLRTRVTAPQFLGSTSWLGPLHSSSVIQLYHRLLQARIVDSEVLRQCQRASLESQSHSTSSNSHSSSGWKCCQNLCNMTFCYRRVFKLIYRAISRNDNLHGLNAIDLRRGWTIKRLNQPEAFRRWSHIYF